MTEDESTKAAVELNMEKALKFAEAWQYRADDCAIMARHLLSSQARVKELETANAWRDISEYRDEMGLVLCGLWVTHNRLNITVWEVYKCMPDDEVDQALDEYGDIVTEWSWSSFTAFMILPTPPAAEKE